MMMSFLTLTEIDLLHRYMCKGGRVLGKIPDLAHVCLRETCVHKRENSSVFYVKGDCVSFSTLPSFSSVSS